jgi:hypothetical protein
LDPEDVAGEGYHGPFGKNDLEFFFVLLAVILLGFQVVFSGAG